VRAPSECSRLRARCLRSALYAGDNLLARDTARQATS
jgi:hypothetical protein